MYRANNINLSIEQIKGSELTSHYTNGPKKTSLIHEQIQKIL